MVSRRKSARSTWNSITFLLPSWMVTFQFHKTNFALGDSGHPEWNCYSSHTAVQPSPTTFIYQNSGTVLYWSHFPDIQNNVRISTSWSSPFLIFGHQYESRPRYHPCASQWRLLNTADASDSQSKTEQIENLLIFLNPSSDATLFKRIRQAKYLAFANMTSLYRQVPPGDITPS